MLYSLIALIVFCLTCYGFKYFKFEVDGPLVILLLLCSGAWPIALPIVCLLGLWAIISIHVVAWINGEYDKDEENK